MNGKLPFGPDDYGWYAYEKMMQLVLAFDEPDQGVRLQIDAREAATADALGWPMARYITGVAFADKSDVRDLDTRPSWLPPHPDV